MIAKQDVSRFAVLAISRFLLVRNQLTGARRKSLRGVAIAGTPERLKVKSGKDWIDAVLMTPKARPPRAAMLLCHGIGETVDDWLAVQHLLAAQGILSLGFSYAGYGRSTGRFSPENCERDALNAFAKLKKRTEGLPLILLGYSMGSGIAAAIAPFAADSGLGRLILGGAFTSLRQGVQSMARSQGAAVWVPDIWRTRDTLATLNLPVLLLHGADDQLFPVSMARDLAGATIPACPLIVLPDCTHDDPIFGPHALFWESVVTEVLQTAPM